MLILWSCIFIQLSTIMRMSHCLFLMFVNKYFKFVNKFMLNQFDEISVSTSNMQLITSHLHFPWILLAYEIQEISVKELVLLLRNYHKGWLQWVWDLRRLTCANFNRPKILNLKKVSRNQCNKAWIATKIKKIKQT